MRELIIACSLKATVILIAASGLCFALRGVSAAVRHLIWTAAFVTLLLLPGVSPIAPRWTIVGQAGRLPEVSQANRPRHLSTQPATPVYSEIDWLPLVWSIGAGLVLARFGAGTARIWLRSRHAKPLPIHGGRAAILDAGPGVMPMTWGALRPVVLLPTEAAGWSVERLRAVVLHELAHVARHDYLTLMMAELAVALYWFHPLAWWAASRLRRERERACDDRVLAAGFNASGYAADLLELARSKDTQLPALAMARASNIETRLRAILDPNVRRRAVSAKATVVAFAVALVALLPLASLRLFGQAGGLRGAVYDPSGAAVPGAEVSVVNSDTGSTQTITSGPVGDYSFPSLPSGRYQVKVRHPGFAVYVRESVAVPASLEIVLSLGQVTESLTVSGKRTGQAAPASVPRRVRVGGNVQAARLLSAQRPAYPPRSEAAGVQGKVVLQAVILMDGGMGGLSVLSSPDPELTQAAIDAVKQWRYQSTLLNGQPVEVVTTITVNFRLDQ